MRWLQAVVAGTVGAGVTFLFATAEALAITATSSQYEMGGIPIILAAFAVLPVIAGLGAGLTAPARPYTAAFIAWGCLILAGSILSSTPGRRLPAESYLFAVQVNPLFVLWGALLADPAPARFRVFRDGTLPVAGFLAFLAAIPVADVFFPGKTAWLPLAALVGFFVWLGRRNRRGR